MAEKGSVVTMRDWWLVGQMPSHGCARLFFS
jgi:hypothetical protein